MDQFRIEMEVHKCICSTVTYNRDGDPDRIFTPLGPMYDGEGVCQGIALMNSYMLNAFGIRAATVSGYMHGSDEKHAWNLVEIDGHWYHEDVTSDLTTDTYFYMNMDDRMAKKTHRFDFPEICDCRDCSFYRHYNSELNSVEEIRDYIRDRYYRGRDRAEFLTGLDRDSLEVGIACALPKGVVDSYSEKDGRVSVCWDQTI